MKTKNGAASMTRKDRSIAGMIFIAVLLALLGLYSFATGYRTGSDFARHDRRI